MDRVGAKEDYGPPPVSGKFEDGILFNFPDECFLST